MGKIKVLDDSVSNMIAAGEVVDSPASLVKELLENSLDAQAKAIRIDIKQGGRYIRIADDGLGMDRSDLLLSVERHATSKISSREDVFNIVTYGFRGEALASIAAVSKLSISSRIATEEVGSELNCVGGKIVGIKTTPRNVGTEIEVSTLFFNTPARLKFLKSNSSEYSAIKDIVLKEALANYNVKIFLTIEGKTLLKTTGGGIKSTIIEIFGIETFKSLVPFKYGYLGNLSLTRGRKDALYTFVNKRVVKANMLEEAIIEGYYTYLMKGKFPFAILFVETPPSEVDINVHPSKKVVRFRESQRLFFSIKDSIALELRQFGTHVKDSISLADISKKEEPVERAVPLENFERYSQVTQQEKIAENSTLKSFANPRKSEIENVSGFASYKDDNRENHSNLESSKGYLKERGEIGYDISGFRKEPTVSLPKGVKILGQLSNMYILVQEGSDLKIFDQHVVDERLIYEQYKQKFLSREVASKQLLIPYKLTLMPTDLVALDKNQEVLKKLGFTYEVVSTTHIELCSIPDFTTRESLYDLFQGILEQLHTENMKDLREELIISMACKAAIKAGQEIPIEKMEELIARLYELGDFTCPHGRPIVITVGATELEKYFKRK